MIKLIFAPVFLKQLKSLPWEIQEEALEKIEFFKNRQNHQVLRAHKLKGNLRGVFSFSVNYRIRIIFQYNTKNEAALLSIGDHDVYRD
ncbi:MAG: hypothetical protein WC621_04640 [Patescibacteria group bacterium]